MRLERERSRVARNVYRRDEITGFTVMKTSHGAADSEECHATLY